MLGVVRFIVVVQHQRLVQLLVLFRGDELITRIVRLHFVHHIALVGRRLIFAFFWHFRPAKARNILLAWRYRFRPVVFRFQIEFGKDFVVKCGTKPFVLLAEFPVCKR